ncbi:ABC transporter substrate-binding protein [Candidatus Cryosericum septentrionale]|jgi:peptide/nickel transport system substrate-binding protein|uniref:ABC transporter substrate-binding protein n=1 Tax=Candidatus Cryosericum septentrionale TaxID=2290913 RepID=A0A398DNW1_9BACT|nr:ABC transporter substrate-binding protein [Candidatus Cryosericum septentrionale]RIE16875.1 ABC transporter substrate-binding protein [Candidatus Cryosericum septentrionale]
MKRSEFVRFLKNGLFFILIASLVLNLVGFQQQTLAATNIKVIRHTDSWPAYIDPAVGSDYASSISICNMYDSLVFPNPDGSVKPWLAKSWVISANALTYTFTLVPGVKFHNGDTLTAADVVFSLQRLMTIGEGYGYLFTSSVKAAKALGTYKVQFTLKQPFGPFLGALVRLYILDKKQVMAHLRTGTYGAFKDYGKGWLVTHDAGSGPYKVKTMKTAESLLMEKFNGYWAGWANKDAPQYAEEIGTTEAVTVRTLISRGALEITDQWQTEENLAAMAKLPNTKLCSFFEGSVLNIMLNTKKAPTDDIHFRKALAYCVDYQQIIAKLFPGTRPSTACPRSLPGYDPNLKPYTLDLAKAQAELKQSKYYGKLAKYPFELDWVSEVPAEEKIALMVQANAAKIGIKVNITKVPWLSLIDLLAKPASTPNGSVIFVAAHYAEAGSMLESRYESSSTGTWEQGEWLQNPQIDILIKAALATVDQKKRFQKYYTIQEKIFALCPTLWILEQAIKQDYRSDYVVFPAAEAVKQGKPVNPVMGYNFYYRDFKVFPEKAKQPYTPFTA